jgi:hypothetical protein
MAKTQSAHQTVRSLTSSIRSSTLSILFGISACAARRGAARGEVAGAQEGSTRITGPPGEGSAAAGAVAGEEGRAGGGGDSSRRRIF